MVLRLLCGRAVDDETGKFLSDPQLKFAHPYPATKIMFIPDKECVHPDLIATTGDYLRIWQVKDDSVQLLKLLNNVRAVPKLDWASSQRLPDCLTN